MNLSKTAIKIWEDNNEKLKAFVCSKTKGSDDCHDILQDVFLKITEKEERIRFAKKPSAYIIQMAKNAVIDYYRAKQSTVLGTQLEEHAATENTSQIQLADCCLLSFIQQLPKAYSEALILTELEGLSQKQFAEKLGLSYTGAKSRVQRARKKLQEAILKCCPYQFDKYGNIIDCCK